MGSDKALFDLAGRPMASYALATLRQAGASRVLALGGDSDALAALGFAAVTEPEPGRGPLGGIVVALEAALDDLVVVVACDLPLVTVAAITALREAAGTGPGAVAWVDGHLQPVVAAYHRRLAPALAAALARDAAVYRAIADCGLVHVELAPELVGPNVNTPADARALSEEIGREGLPRPPAPTIRRRSTWPAGGGG
jgi:molybdopterin-guanine dinucleotide biosynthesis protein A